METLSAVPDAELIRRAHLNVENSHALHAELLLLLGEIEERQLFARRAFPSLFDFCTKELGFS